MLKRVFNFIFYSLTALLACFFSLILVLNFLNPAFSKTDVGIQKIGFKESLSQLFSDFIITLKGGVVNKDSSPNKPDPSDSIPSAPESYEGDLVQQGVEEPSPAQGTENLGEPAPDQGTENLGGPASDQGTENLGGPAPAQGTENLGGPAPAQGTENLGGPAPDQGTENLGESAPAQGTENLGGPAPDQGTENLGGPVPDQGTENLGGFAPDQGTENLGGPDPALEDLDSELPSEISLQIQSDMAPFVYEHSNTRDPFQDPTRRKSFKKGQTEVKVIIPKTPPEMHKIKDIELKGIIWNIQNPKALFKLPGSEDHYTLIRGDKVGTHGIIFEIREDEVIIVEPSLQNDQERSIIIKKMDRLGLD